MLARQINMYFGQRTFIGAKLVKHCNELGISYERVVAILAKTHSRNRDIPENNFPYWGGKIYISLESALTMIPKEVYTQDLEDELYKWRRFKALMDGEDAPKRPVTPTEPTPPASSDTLPEDIDPGDGLAEKEPKKDNWFNSTRLKIVAGISSILGMLGVAAWLKPELRPIVDILKKIRDLLE